MGNGKAGRFGASQNARHLFRRFPRLSQIVPWIPLGELPTPVLRLPALSPTADVWVKRDDLSASLYGGNKVRTLEFSLAGALQKGAATVVTYGVHGSNWLVASALYARLLGLRCRAHTFPRTLDTARERNADLLRALANRVVAHRNAADMLLGLSWERVTWRTLVAVLPPGGTSPFACLGYVNAVLELAEQVESGLLPRPDVVYVPLGSGGTCAGILVGLELLGWPTRLVGVRVADWIVANRFAVGILARRCSNLLRRADPVLPPHPRLLRRFRIDHGWIGRGYGHPTEAAGRALDELAACGLQLDTTYTGKTMACLLHDLRGAASPGKVILFWHTLNSRPLERLVEAMGTTAAAASGSRPADAGTP